MKAGRRLRTEHLEVRSIDSLLSHARVAVVVGKHGYEIVARNRLRRRLREITRVALIPELGALDVVIRATPRAYDASFDELNAELKTIAGRLSRG